MTTFAPAPPAPAPVVAPPPKRARNWTTPALVALLVGAAVLYLWDLSASGYANSFYAAAVQAGSKSWKALLFGSLDAGNSITVDKPPAALWIMGLSARIFGFNSWSLLVPQAIEGVLSVWLTYATVKRLATPATGLLAGAMFALTPVAVLMFRFDNPDALLVLLLVAAAYCTVRAVERAGAGWLMLAGVALGFGFLTKLGQALLVLPALALVYLVAAPTGLGKRIRHLLYAAVALIVSAGWYVALVQLWPAADRPYIGGSTNNSLLELALGYNGIGRLWSSSSSGGGGGGGGGFGGSTGITRMFNSTFGTEISWLLPAALIGLVAGLWFTRRAPRTDRTRAALLLWGGWLLVSALVFSFMSGIIHAYYTIALAPAIAALVAISVRELWRGKEFLAARAALALMVAATGIWSFVLLGRDTSFLPELRWVVLILAVVSSGVVLLGVGLAKRTAVVVLAAVAISGLLGSSAWAVSTAGNAHTGSIPNSGPASYNSSGMGGTGGTGGGPSGERPSGSGGGMGGTPPSGSNSGRRTSGSSTESSTESSTGSSTESRPSGSTESSASGTGGGGGGMTGSGTTSSALTTLLTNAGTTWSAAVVGSQNAASLELSTGTSVIAIGGWDGSDPAPTLAQFETWVKEGKIHYLIASGGQGGGSTGTYNSILTWVKAHYTAETVGGTTIYDLIKATG
ncbi:MAG TPA: glycosyltransferase family 39 protein [Pseudonocardiaceae bacterium]|jgi:4-amino-4-deoxy-L-arabinose transferase-like glycosyltransferase|nr:glycosyltransferase family 39 protein [Pseudonocardiaceae bacterium]